MVRLRTLGTLDLRDAAGNELARVLVQPKRMALLLVLVLSGPDRFLRRDQLLAMFWPELDATRARHALRQALYVLRGALGPDAIASRGDEEVAIVAGSVWCDVHAFDALLANDRRREALDLYTGDLLPSFHVTDVSADFDHWLEAQRARLRAAAARAAWSLAAEYKSAGNGIQAALWARRAVGIVPEDEAALRQLVIVLEALGDRVGAVREYHAFEHRLGEEYGLSPSPETRALLARLQAQEDAPAAALSDGNESHSPGEALAARELSHHAHHGEPANSSKYVAPKARGVERRTGAEKRRRRVAGAALLLTLLASGAVVASHFTAASKSGVADISFGARDAAGTMSPMAMRFYDEGMRAQYIGDARGAYRLFVAALAEDTMFALAAFHAALNLPAPRRDSSEQPASALLFERAVHLAEHAPERDRLIITLHRVRSERARYAAVAESLGARFPSEPVGHYALAQVRFGAGDFLSAVVEARRALSLDSLTHYSSLCNACDAYRVLIYAFVYADSLSAAEQVARGGVRVWPGSANAWHDLSGVLGGQGRRNEALAAYRRAEALDAAAADAWTPVRIALLADDYAEAEDLIESRIRLDGVSSNSHWWRIISLRNQGRLTEALTAARDLKRIASWSGSLAEAQVLFEMGHYKRAARRFESSARALATSAIDPGARARDMSWLLTHAASAWVAAGDTARLARLADTIQSVAHLSAYGRDWRLPAHIRGLLWQARGVPERATEEFRAALFSPGDGFTRTNLEWARALLSLGRPQAAVAVLQPALRGSVDGSNFYVTRSELHEMLARAFEAAYQPDSAATHYALVAAAWNDAESGMRQRAEIARRRAVALR